MMADGGRALSLPADASPMERAIALAFSHPLGVGNAYFRIGVSGRRWVDTVPFGCFRRELFDRIGVFDEELVRNQDDEFNLRLIRHGGRLPPLPGRRAPFYARRSPPPPARGVFSSRLFQPPGAPQVRGGPPP